MEQQHTYFMAWVEDSGDHDSYGLYANKDDAIVFVTNHFPGGHHVLLGPDSTDGQYHDCTTEAGFFLQGYVTHGESMAATPDNMVGWVAECPVR